MQKTDVVTSERLIIAALTDEQHQPLIESQTDEHMKAAYGEMLEGSRQHPPERLWWCCWRISLKDGTPVGDLCFKGAPVDGGVEIGYGIEPEHQNNGYITEAVNAVTQWAFTQPGCLFVYAQVEPDNAPSLRVMEKCGFEPIGNGEEGLLFITKKPETPRMPVFMCLGMAIGVAIGASTNMCLGLSLGVCFGMLLGVAADSSARKSCDEQYKKLLERICIK